MTARWYAAWILCFDITIVFCMYGLWLTLTLLGRLAPVGEGLVHKHSMTGLNLSAGNGLLSYDCDQGAIHGASLGGAMLTGASISSSSNSKTAAGSLGKRNLSNNNSSPSSSAVGLSFEAAEEGGIR